ncbi:MAG: hypothetical protein RLZZ603_1366, partial [Actinomycetota bacterium]
EAWDALDEVWRLMAADPRFETTVISIPRKLTGDEGFGGEENVSAFLTTHDVPHLRFNFEDSAEGLARLRELAPDYVFVNYPWRRNYPAGYRPETLAEFTRVAYVPYYSLPLVNEPGETGVASHLYEQRTHQLASLVFTLDAADLDAYARTDRGNGYVHLTGSPKIDHLLRLANEGVAEWPIAAPTPGPNRPNAGRRYRVVWAPHHSYDDSWLNFGLFSQMHAQMLQLALGHAEIDFVLRPHPFLFGTMVDRSLMTQQQLDAWLEDWNDLPNTAIHTEGDYASLFKATDLLLTDGISFLGEYPLVTGRPTVFLEKEGHWQFSPLGEIAADANIRLSDFGAFETLLDAIRTEGMPDYSEAIAKLRATASPYPGKAASKIVEIVASDAAAGTGLVDASQVKALAWEFRSGREPQPQ